MPYTQDDEVFGRRRQRNMVFEDFQPTFGYPRGTGELVGFTQFDIRSSICQAIGGYDHGDVVEDYEGNRATAIGVALVEDLPEMFFHCVGKPGAGIYSNYEDLKGFFTFHSSTKVQEAFRNDPRFLLDSYDGVNFKFDFQFIIEKGGEIMEARFDIRDEVCRAVAGFRHGEVVRDQDGSELTVLGVLDQAENFGSRRLWLCSEFETRSYNLEETRRLRAIGRVEDLQTDWRHATQ